MAGDRLSSFFWPHAVSLLTPHRPPVPLDKLSHEVFVNGGVRP